LKPNNMQSSGLGVGKRSGTYPIVCIVLGAVVASLWLGATAAEVKRLGEDHRRPCTNHVSLFVDNEEQWNQSLDELRKLENVVNFTEGRQKGKQGIPLADLLLGVEDVQAVEISTCTGKLRRFDAEELERKQDSLYFIITRYRGLKLHNAAGGEKKKKGSGLKGIDRIRLITRPE